MALLGKKSEVYLNDAAVSALQAEIDNHPHLAALTPVAQRSMYIAYMLTGSWPDVDLFEMQAHVGSNRD